MSKKRSLAGFVDVATDIDIKNDNDININNDIKNESNIINEVMKKKETKKFTGIYFDPDVLAVLNRLSKGSKGAKSEIVNKAVKVLFEKEGYM